MDRDEEGTMKKGRGIYHKNYFSKTQKECNFYV